MRRWKSRVCQPLKRSSAPEAPEEISRWRNHRKTGAKTLPALEGRQTKASVRRPSRAQVPSHPVPVVSPPANIRCPSGTKKRESQMKRSLLRHSLSLLCACALLFPSPTFAQRQSSPKKFELTVDSIMRGPDLIGYEPTRVYWSQDGRRVYFRWKRAGEARLKEPDLYVVNRDGGGLRKLSEEEAKGAAPPAGDLSKDKTMT